MSRFKFPLGQKVYLHKQIIELFSRKKTIHVIDTKHNHSKQLFSTSFDNVHQIGSDFNIYSTDYLRKTKQKPSDLIWLDYCRSPKAPFVDDDLQLCKTNVVLCTFSMRGCPNWKYKINYLGKKSGYKVSWIYHYHDTSPMLLVCYYKGIKKPRKIFNPVGKTYQFRYKNKWYSRKCKKILLGPKTDPVLYFKFRDSNEPIINCKLVTKYV